MGERIVIADPALANPLADAGEITAAGGDGGRISEAHGCASFGESARRVSSTRGKPAELWLGGVKLVPEGSLVAELTGRYARPARAKRRSSPRRTIR